VLRVTVALVSDGQLSETGVAITAMLTAIPSRTWFFIVASLWYATFEQQAEHQLERGNAPP
jgi:hypothetical protein